MTSFSNLYNEHKFGNHISEKMYGFFNLSRNQPILPFYKFLLIEFEAVMFLAVSFFSMSQLLADFIRSLNRDFKNIWIDQSTLKSSLPDVFLRKVALKICSKFPGEHPYRSMISIKLFCNFNEITLWHGCSSVNLLHIFRTPLLKNTSGGLFLYTTLLLVKLIS